MRIARLCLPIIAAAYILAAIVAIGVFAGPPIALGIPALLLAALLADGIFRPSSSLFYPTILHGSRAGNRVALSFDDGPDPATTPRVLDLLAQHGARASFFVIGRALESQPEIGRRIVAEGHALGNHSWRHSRWQNFYPRKAFEREIERGEESIAAFAGKTQPPYRPPIGIKSPALARIAYRRGLTVIAWSLHSRDTRLRDPERIAKRVLRKVRPGDIVLLHDGHDLPGRHRPACVEATSLILAGLRERGLVCVSIPELLCQPLCATDPDPTGMEQPSGSTYGAPR